jgi:hypothetical protein
MKQSLWAGLAGLSCVALVAAPALAKAMMIAPPPLPQRAAVAEVIVVGKVTSFGDKLVSAKPPYGGDKNADYQIAIVKISDPIAGVKDAKEIKVGFIPPQAPPPNPNPGGPAVFIKRYPQFTLALDQEACLFLVKHPTEDFYIGMNYYDIVNKQNNADFDKNVDEVKRAAKLLADPAAGFQSKSADDRFLTAALLITRYRTARPGPVAPKTEPIDAAESKQILQTLADADWNAKPMGPFAFQMTPQAIFFRLNPTPADGWTQPKDAKDIPDAAKQWCKDNVEKYRIQRFVAEKKDEKKDDK